MKSSSLPINLKVQILGCCYILELRNMAEDNAAKKEKGEKVIKIRDTGDHNNEEVIIARSSSE